MARIKSLKDRAGAVGIHGEWFGSLKEGRRYIELKRLESAGEIRDLKLQQVFPITIIPHAEGVPAVNCGTYRADFTFQWLEPGGIGHSDVWTHAVEDVKGVRTPVYKLKKKLVESLYGITITEM